MARTVVDLDFTRGDDVVRSFAWQDESGDPIDLTGWTFRAQIRTEPGGPTHWSFSITTDDEAGTVTLTLAHAVTATVTPGRAWWDLERTIGGQVDTPLAGRVTVYPDVTR